MTARWAPAPGAAVIFGTTGGVMDAALRGAYHMVTGKNPDADAFREIRGSKPWKEAVFTIPGAGEVPGGGSQRPF